MKVALLAAVAFAVAGPAFAEEGACSSAPQSAWQPQSALEAQLKSEGMTVRQIKIENGCYEVYAMDSAGKRVNLAYNAETLQRLANAEAGED